MGRFNLVEWKNVAKEAFERTLIIAKFLCLLHVTESHLCSTVLVYGPSMYPTMNHSGDLVLVDRMSTRLGIVKNGDIVVVKSPSNPKRCITKRVLGMEGDRVTFLVDPLRTQSLVVPKGHVWIQGDNIYDSTDSRYFGPIPYGLLQGKVFCRIWPPDAFGSLSQRNGQ